LTVSGHTARATRGRLAPSAETIGFLLLPVDPCRPRLGWSEPVPGRELHPLKSSAFSRRTLSPTILLSHRQLMAFIDVPVSPT